MAESQPNPSASSSPASPDGASGTSSDGPASGAETGAGRTSEGRSSGRGSGDDSYLVAARKYRPTRFREVVAQEHVTDTLKNALKLDRLAHAYLFSGPRGVGKTTTARILAKAINCETPRSEREDEAEPCRECDSCRAFEDGRSLNVFEMDAASNNKVDDIRELRETVRIPPQGSTKKVYILDEVHMLSTQAFNALLKTLEEPPPHALFIFATTEPHKVLPTILSRCQRFDFRRIPVPEIVDHLRQICDNEGIEADEESLMLLARKGDGALRDALSAFDQAISLCGTTLEYSDLTQALGVVDQDLFFRLTDHVATQDTAGVLKLVNHVVRSGYDLQEFLSGLAEHLRNLLVARSISGEALEEVAASTQKRYHEEAQRFGEADLLRLLTIAGDAEDDVKNSSQPRLKLEMALLKMAQMRRAADLKKVLRKIDRLEKMVEEGDFPDTLPFGSDGDASGPNPSSQDAPGGSSPGSPSGSPSGNSPSDNSPSGGSPSGGSPSGGSPSGNSPSGGPSEGNPSTASEPSVSYDATGGTGDAPTGSADPSTDSASPSENSPEASAPAPAPDAASSPPDASHPTSSNASPSTETSPTQTPSTQASPTESDDALPDEPDDPAFTTPFDEDPSAGSDAQGDVQGDTQGDVQTDNHSGDAAGDSSTPEGGSGDVEYGDLFGTPALDKKKSTNDSPEDGTGSSPQDTVQTATGPSGSQGDGQAVGSAESVVAEPSGGSASPNGEPSNGQAAGTDGSTSGCASSDPANDPVLKHVRSEWDAFVQAVMSERISLGALLGEATAQSFNGRTLVIGVPKALHRDQFRSNKPFLLDKVQSVADDVEALQIVVDRSQDESSSGSTSGSESDTMNPREKMESLRDTYPALDRLFDQFGAELVW